MPRRQYTPDRMRAALVDKRLHEYIQQQQAMAAEAQKIKAAAAAPPPPQVTITPPEPELQVKLEPEPEVKASVSESPAHHPLVVRTPHAPIDRTHHKPLTLSDLAVAIDDSGSTDGRVSDHELLYVGRHLGAVSHRSGNLDVHAGEQPLILWSSTARFVPPKAVGTLQFSTTNPYAIFHPSSYDCVRLVSERPVFVLSTDGQIQTDDVQLMAQRSATILSQKTLNVGILVLDGSAEETRLAHQNVSVLAPLMVGPYVFLVHFVSPEDQPVFHVVATNCSEVCRHLGVAALPDITERSEWKSFPTVKRLDTFLTSLSFSMVTPRLSSSEVLIVRSNEHETWSLRWDQLSPLLHDHQAALAELPTWDWTSVLAQARLFPEKLQQLRQLLVQINQHVVPVVAPPSTEAQHRAQQIEQLGRMLAERQCATSQHEDDVRAMYLSLRQQALAQEFDARRAAWDQQRTHKAFLEGLLADITELDRAGWSLADLKRGYGNRALRASTISVSSPDERLKAFVEQTDPSSFYTMDCQICMEHAPAALMLIPRENEQDQFYLSDFAIDCPLACGYQASQKFSNFHVCVSCAQFFLLRGEDVYHRPLLDVWPVLKPPADGAPYPIAAQKHYREVVQHAFLHDKNMDHGLSLMLAAVENLNQYPWGCEGLWPGLREALLEGLCQTVSVHPTLSNSSGSERVSLIQAARHVLHHTEVFTLKPTALQYLLLRLNQYYGWVTAEEQHRLELSALTSSLINILRKLRKDQLQEVYDQFLLQTHDHPLNIPVRGTFHPALIQEWSPELNQLVTLRRSLATSRLTDMEWTHILRTVLAHRSQFHAFTFEALLSHLSRQDPALLQLLYPSPVPIVWPSSPPDLLPRHFVSDAQHSIDPVPFYLNLGEYSCPDPLQCVCGQLFYDPDRVATQSLSEVVACVQQRRKQHFETVYGSENPNRKSSHYPLHSTVAAVMHDHPLDTDDATLLQAVAQRLRQTAGQKGDIFKPQLMAKIAWTLADLRRLQRESPNWAEPRWSDQPLVARSLAFKVFCALQLKKLWPANATFSPEER